MSFRVTTVILSAPLANAGTLQVAYPPGTSRSDFIRGLRHVVRANQGLFVSPNDFTVAFGATLATITWGSLTTLPANASVSIQFDTAGSEGYRDAPANRRMPPRSFDAFARVLRLGNPQAASANAVCLSQAVAAAAPALLNGALGNTLDVPRNLVAAWTNAAVMTVTGLDEYGAPLVEQSPSGTAFTGVKAFSRITSVTFNAAVTGATVGTGLRIGLPVFLPDASLVLRELIDGAAAGAGTLVAGLSPATRGTALTADVRGTYQPALAPDGSRVWELLVALPDPNHRGNPQFV